ncbi:HAD-IIB family hydrolase [Haploplasma axanthum]|uniref:COF family HAD hydrolase protein n=1 Tax=Haploplasma axanthum TaxID=29552 RepID=A0A449BFV4_HAPAX|nr:HAD-IIB family hydrolase [Haploplasma axanthum]VEU81321.1 COF family HAD hydrolase protein [Haploplasma axanthum]
MKKKIIYSDLDGTLFNLDSNNKSYFSNENISAINDWIRDGNLFGVATGRNISSVSPFFKDTKLKFNLPFVLSNGTLVYDYAHSKIIYQEILNKEALQEAIGYAFKNDVVLAIMSPYEHYIIVQDKEKSIIEVGFPYTKVYVDEIDYKNITKASFVVDPSQNEKVREEAKAFKSFDKIEVIPSGSSYVELVNKDTSKRSAIEIALKYANIKEYDLYTIGDHINDYEMVKNAYGFAPLNAHDEVKDAAKHVVCHHNDGALVEMIKIIRNKSI